MGHKHKGAAQSVMQLKEQIAGGHARVFVQVAGWFISQNQRRRMHQRPGDCDTLLFTRRKAASGSVTRDEPDPLAKEFPEPLHLRRHLLQFAAATRHCPGQ